jgi:tetratricopeptide (TPR) repeat protein
MERKMNCSNIVVVKYVLSCTQRTEKQQLISTFNVLNQLMANGDNLRAQNPDSALKIYHKAAELIRPGTKDDSLLVILGFLYNKIAAIKYDAGEYPEAEKMDSLAMDLALSTENTQLMAHVCNTNGLLHYAKGDYPTAIENYNVAMEKASESNDNAILAKIYTNLGIIRYIQGNIDSATLFLKKTYNLALLNRDTTLIAGCCNNLAIVFIIPGNTIVQGFIIRKHLIWLF